MQPNTFRGHESITGSDKNDFRGHYATHSSAILAEDN